MEMDRHTRRIIKEKSIPNDMKVLGSGVIIAIALSYSFLRFDVI